MSSHAFARLVSLCHSSRLAGLAAPPFTLAWPSSCMVRGKMFAVKKTQYVCSYRRACVSVCVLKTIYILRKLTQHQKICWKIMTLPEVHLAWKVQPILETMKGSLESDWLVSYPITPITELFSPQQECHLRDSRCASNKRKPPTSNLMRLDF